MKTHIENRTLVALGLLGLAAVWEPGQDLSAQPATPVHWCVSGTGSQPRLEGDLLTDPSGGLKFLPLGGDQKQPLILGAGSTLSFQGTQPQAVSIPPLFRVQVGETARISGMLRAVSDKAVSLSVPWQSAEVVVAPARGPGGSPAPRRGQAVCRPVRPASATRDGPSAASRRFWTRQARTNQGRRVRLPAGDSSLRHRLAEPLGSGRVELSLFDEGKVAAGQRWTLELTFRGPTGPATIRILLGWAEESLAVESPDGPALAVQRLARSAGWHRLTTRFGPEQTEIAVDGKELAHGKSPSGPLDAIRIATSVVGSSPAAPPGLAGYLGEIQIVRFAEPPTSLEIDPSQDEVRLVVGDQLYGQVRKADHEHVAIETADKLVALDWSEVAGIFFRRIPAVAAPVAGTLARLEWRTMPGEPSKGRELDHAEGAITAISDSAITLATPYAGTLTVPRDRLAFLRVLDRGWLRVIDPCAHHLGDNISTTPPLLDPPLPEGGVLERSFELDAVPPGQAFVVLDVVQVVGETAGSPYSNLVQKGELRTYVVLNGKRIDYINRYITTCQRDARANPDSDPAGPLEARQERDADRTDRHRQRPDLVRRPGDTSGGPAVLDDREPRRPIGRRAQPRNPDGRFYEDVDAHHGPARPCDRPRGRFPGDHAPCRRHRRRCRSLVAARGREFSGHSRLAPARSFGSGGTQGHVLGHSCSRHRHDPRRAGQGGDTGRGGREPGEGRRPDSLPDGDRRLGSDRYDHGSGHGHRDRAVLGIHGRPLAQGRDPGGLRANA